MTSCPLCHFNLDESQKRTSGNGSSTPAIPILYFTQLMALALQLPDKATALEKNVVDPRPLLREKGFL